MEEQRQRKMDWDIHETDRKCLCCVRMVVELYKTAVTCAPHNVIGGYVSINPSTMDFIRSSVFPSCHLYFWRIHKVWFEIINMTCFSTLVLKFKGSVHKDNFKCKGSGGYLSLNLCIHNLYQHKCQPQVKGVMRDIWKKTNYTSLFDDHRTVEL